MRGSCCKCGQTRNYCVFYKQIDRLSFVICPKCLEKENMIELKTLQDIGTRGRATVDYRAIKWVKKDLDEINKGIMFSAKTCLNGWMKRLDITEDDLQEDHEEDLK